MKFYGEYVHLVWLQRWSGTHNQWVYVVMISCESTMKKHVMALLIGQNTGILLMVMKGESYQMPSAGTTPQWMNLGINHQTYTLENPKNCAANPSEVSLYQYLFISYE